MVAAATNALGHLADAGPALLVVDDLYWADAETRAVLAGLAEGIARLPLLLLATRPDGIGEEVPDPLRRLPLGPLAAPDATRLAARLLGEELAAQPDLAARAGGNPLFIEAQAAARREGSTESCLPESVRAVLGARIDRIGPDSRGALEAMAAYGEPSAIPLLAAFAELPERATAEAAADLAARIARKPTAGRRRGLGTSRSLAPPA